MDIAARRNESAPLFDINMTPLIDVMLVLLIIFIITLRKHTHAVRMDNPPPSPTTSPPTEVINLSIDFDGTLLWNGTAVDRAMLRQYIRLEAAKAVQPEVHIVVDRFSRYEVVAQTLSDLQRLGLRKIGLVNNSLF